MAIVCVSRRASAIVAVLTTGTVEGTSPVFPTRVVEENCSISFEIGTKWRSIKGKLQGFSGAVSLNDGGDLQTAHGRIVFPLDQLRTSSTLINRKLFTLCEGRVHPRARYSLLGLSGIGNLELLGVGDSIGVQLDGVLTIRAISQIVPVVGVLKRTPCHFCFSGEASFDWRKFGIQRPRSYLLWRVSPLVKIHVETILHANEASRE